MEGTLTYTRVWTSLLLVGTLALGCSNDGAKTTSESSSVASNDSSEEGDDAYAEGDDGEQALDPSRSYPTASSAGKKPNAGATVANANNAASGGVTADEDRASRALPPTNNTAVVPPTTPVQPAAAQPVNPFVEANKDPFSTFGADVDTASYDRLRQTLQQGRLPAPSEVRVEDYVNYFKYQYPVPAADAAQPFSIALAAAAHPAGRATTLLRVGIQAKAAPPIANKQANVVFLVDVSGSMASGDKLPLVKRVLEQALGVLQPTDKVSIVSYASDTRVRLGPTPVASRELILPIIQGLEAGGSTNGGSGINLAYEQAGAGLVAGGINHVILCTDGDFNLGITSNDALVQLIREKRNTGITLTALGFGTDVLNDDMMEKVSNAGNGSYSIVYDADQATEYANERLLSTVVHVAKDMKIQVEFNPTAVLAYRLLGYEDRAIADSSFRNDKVDGGEVGAEHRVTALYELVLTGGQVPAPAGAPALSPGETSMLVREVDPAELVRVKVRSKSVTATDADPATEVSAALKPVEVQPSADADLAWAAAVAATAELLRKSPYATMGELAQIEGIVNAQKERDSDRSEFAKLLPQIRALLAPPSTMP